MFTSTLCQAGCWRQPKVRVALPVICLTAILAAGLAHAQEASQRPLIEYLPASASHEPLSPTNSASAYQRSDVTSNDAAMARTQGPRKHLTSGERWEKFEVEFGIRQKDPSLIKGYMESAKYELDRTLFGMQEILQDIQKACSFDYEIRNLGRLPSADNRSTSSSVPIPLWETMERARFQSDIDLNMAGGRAYVGVQLVLPIGN
jgi:hypothetical protein